MGNFQSIEEDDDQDISVRCEENSVQETNVN